MTRPSPTLGSSSSSDADMETVGMEGTAASREPEAGVGTALGRFVVLEEVGRGGMGRVLRAYDPKLQREVALKVLRGEMLRGEGHARLVREAQAMARLSHPNVVAVYDVEDTPRGVVLVMEFVDGVTLQRWLRRSRAWREVLASFVDAGRGLAAAHAQGLLHRDFKPANVLVASDGRVKVTDFGLAKSAPEGPASLRRASASFPSVDLSLLESGDASLVDELTHAGTVIGTPKYMAPEQHCGEPLDAAVDQYAFCMVLWEALAGTWPFAPPESESERKSESEPERDRDDPYRDVVRRKLAGPGAWPTGVAVPKEVIEALRRGLRARPDERWPSMNALLDRLDRALAPSRRRELVGLVLVGALASGGVAWISAASTGAETPCSGAQARLGDAWDEAERARVEQAILATGASYAPGVATYVSTALDDYAEAWVTAHRESCEATTVRGEQSATVMDLRMACLQRAQVKLRATTAVLVGADAAMLEHAHELVRGLDVLERCADVEALQAAVAPPSAAQAQAVDELRATLADAGARTLAGRYDDARALLDAAQGEGDALGYEPLTTELELARGRLLHEQGEYDAAEATLRRVLRLGTKWGQWAEVRSAATQLIMVVGYLQAHPDEGLRYRDLAEGLVERSGDAEARIELANSLAAIAFQRGQFAEAAAEFRRTAELAAQLLGPRDLDALKPLSNLALAQYRQGELDAAEAGLRHVAAEHEALLGAEHPLTADTLGSLALVLFAKGDYVQAEAVNRRVLEIRERAYGPAHPMLANVLNNLANALHAQGKYAEASQLLGRAALLLEQSLGAEHPNALAARMNAAVLLKTEGRFAEAEAEYRRVLALQEQALGPEHPNLTNTHNNLANVLGAQGRHEEAEAAHRRTLALIAASIGADSLEAANSHHNLATELQSQGKLAEAEVELRRALELRTPKLAPGNEEVAASRQRLAMVLLALDRAAEALPLAEQSWSAREHGAGKPERRAESAFVLAQALRETHGARERARELAQEAEAGFGAAGEQWEDERAQVQAWLRESPR